MMSAMTEYGVRVFLLPRFNPSSVQSISGVRKPPREQMNWSGELYVTDWFLSSGLISGGPGHRINKHNSKKVKLWQKKHYKWEENLRETVVIQHLPVTVIWKADSFLSSLLLALHLYWPASPKVTRLIVKMLLLLRLNPSLVQSISGVGKPLTEHLNWSDELYVTDWFLSSGLISGGPGHRINKKNFKKVEVWKEQQKIRRATERKWVSQHLPVTVI